MKNPLIDPAAKLCEVLQSRYPQQVDNEIMVLDAKSVAIVADLDGTDYVMTMMRLPRQRQRPAAEGGEA